MRVILLLIGSPVLPVAAVVVYLKWDCTKKVVVTRLFLFCLVSQT